MARFQIKTEQWELVYRVHCLRKFKLTNVNVNTNILFLSESEEQQRIRFQTELEFVQCLANPNYLNCK